MMFQQSIIEDIFSFITQEHSQYSKLYYQQIAASLYYIRDNMKKKELKEIRVLSGKQKADKLGLKSTRFVLSEMSSNAKNKIDCIKRKDNPHITPQEWSPKQYYKTNATNTLFDCHDCVAREHIKKLSVKNFEDEYERKDRPVIIDGCTQNWETDKYWNFQYFYEQYKDKVFTVAEDKHGKKLKLQFKYFMEYLIYNRDDSPLYLVDDTLQDDEDVERILQFYQIPPYFKDDLLSLTGQRYRPPFRWLEIGPERSGTVINTDQYKESFWSTLIVGYKRWVLFPPHIPKFIVRGKSYRSQNQRYQSLRYFLQLLPKIIEEEGRQRLGVVEFIQNPGQTVFVPSGWWYAMVNLEDTISISQSIMTHINFDKVWRELRCKQIPFSENFLLLLRKHEFALYQRALQINKDDNFEMGHKYEKQSVSLSFSSDSSLPSNNSSKFYSQISYSRSSKRSQSHNSRGQRFRSRDKKSQRRSYSHGQASKTYPPQA